MKVEWHCDIEKDLKSLKRFLTPRESLEAWERLFIAKGLREISGIDSFPGFGMGKIYKARVVPLRENIGKSGGYRVIFQIVEDENCSNEDICKIIAFVRKNNYKESGLITIIKERYDYN